MPAGAAERQGQRAGVVSRVGAMVVDAGYAVAVVAVLYFAFAAFRFMRDARHFAWPQLSINDGLVAAAVVAVFELSLAWCTTGRTMGMRFMGLRLVDRHGRHIHLPRSILRAVTCVLFPLGLFWSAVSRRNASVHDLVFRTSVIYDWETRVPPTTP
jgi:uncharacterized RDD family membrane protein YckC